MNGLYIFTRFITCPGAWVRGFFEHLVCKISSIPVEDNRILTRDEMASHIEHELAPTPRKAFALCFVPAFFNGLFAFILAMCSVTGLFYYEQSAPVDIIVNAVSYWFAFSLFVNSYPSVEDALNMKDMVYKYGTVLQKIVYAPAFVLLYLGAFLEKYCITFVIAVAGFAALLMI